MARDQLEGVEARCRKRRRAPSLISRLPGSIMNVYSGQISENVEDFNPVTNDQS